MNSDSDAGAAVARALSGDDRWLRRLVGSLVPECDVDDVLQDTRLAAFERVGEERPVLRAWLATVARRLAFRHRRTAARRQRRERTAARPECAPDGSTLVQRIELRQEVTRIVLALEEPYRRTLLRRFYEDLSPAEIARLENVPAATVRSRLHRGLERVRGALAARDFGTDPAWPALLAAAVPSRAAATTVLLSAKSNALAAAALVSLLVALVVMASRTAPDGTPGGDPLVGRPIVATESDGAGEDPGTPAPQRALAAAGGPVAAAGDDTVAPRARTISGRVLDPHGRPLAGVPIHLRDRLDEPTGGAAAEPLARSRDDGTFIATVDAGGWLALGRPWIALRPWPVRASDDQECVIVAAPAVRLAGIVTDERGWPLEGVTITGFCERVTTFPGILDATGRPTFPGAVTDAGGRFAIDPAVGSEHVFYTFTCLDHERVDLVAPQRDDLELRVVMPAREGAAAFVVTGRVHDAAGVPLPDATVGYGRSETRTDANGDYRLPIPALDPHEVLFAAAPGTRAAVRVLQAHEFGAARERAIDLQLGAATGSIAGVVLGADGEPWTGVEVYLWNLEYLGSSSHTAIGFDVGADDEWLGPSAVTDDAGAFVLRGLPAGEYRLRILDRGTPFGFTTEPVRTGRTDVAIRVPLAAWRSQLHGRVVDASGRGIEGARVRHRVEIRMRDGQGVCTHSAPTVTDAAGAFVLERVPADRVRIEVDGDDILPASHDLAAGDAGNGIRITADRRCRFRVVLETLRPGGEVELLDEASQPLTIHSFAAGGRITADHWPLADGRTQVLTVSERAREIVLRQGGSVVRRLPVDLRGVGVQEIRF